MKRFVFSALFPLTIVLAGLFAAGLLFSAPLSGPWSAPSGNYVSQDGKGYLALRPGGRVYVRRDGEDRFTLYRTKVHASVRNEYWLERVGDVTRTGASAAPPPGAIPPAEKEAAAKTAAEDAPPTKPSFFARLFGKKSDESSDPATAEAAEKERAQASAAEVEAKLATAWFSDSTRLVFVFDPGVLTVLIFEDDELKGRLNFRRIKFRLAVPDHLQG